MTFSVCVRETREEGTTFGAAVATDAPAVGALAPYVSERGAICTQSFVNVRLGRRGLVLLEDLSVEDAVAGLLAQDDSAELRQVHGLDARGGSYAFSGDDCDEWFGHRIDDGREATAAGNMLVGPETLDSVLEALDGDYADTVDRLLAALRAGRDAGGDKRGHSSAAVRVWAPRTTAYHDLRVDYHESPVEELREVYDAAKDASDEFSEETKDRVFD